MLENKFSLNSIAYAIPFGTSWCQLGLLTTFTRNYVLHKKSFNPTTNFTCSSYWLSEKS